MVSGFGTVHMMWHEPNKELRGCSIQPTVTFEPKHATRCVGLCLQKQSSILFIHAKPSKEDAIMVMQRKWILSMRGMLRNNRAWYQNSINLRMYACNLRCAFVRVILWDFIYVDLAKLANWSKPKIAEIKFLSITLTGEPTIPSGTSCVWNVSKNSIYIEIQNIDMCVSVSRIWIVKPKVEYLYICTYNFKAIKFSFAIQVQIINSISSCAIQIQFKKKKKSNSKFKLPASNSDINNSSCLQLDNKE